MRIISIRENPEFMCAAIGYISGRWPEVPSEVYDDCIRNSLMAAGPLPQWYLMVSDDVIVGCAGLIGNDFISRMDLTPWACSLYIEEWLRGHGCGRLLLERVAEDARRTGFENLYLSTEHEGLYENWGFHYLGQGYHPWGGESRIYEQSL